MNITIIGGGVIGLCCAYYLRKEGHDVTVIDKNDITTGCSFGNMGYISPSHFIPLASPGIISQGLKWMLSSSSPFYIKPRLNADLFRWGIRFWRSSKNKLVEKNAPRLNDLLQLSRHCMNELKKDLPGEFDMIEKGCWMLYKSEKTGDHEKKLAEQATRLGLKTISCDAAQVQSYEPDVEVSVKGGILYLDDCHINTTKFMQLLYTTLQKDGVKFWLNTEVTGFEKKDGKIISILIPGNKIDVEEVVMANGSWMGKTSALLGIKMLMQPGKGYSISYDAVEKNLHFPSILVDDRAATTPIGSWLRLGGTMEISGHSDNILPKRVMAIYHAFKKYYPGVVIPEPDLQKAWFGYRPVTPDGLPYIGRDHTYNNLSFAGGHAMLGVSAAAGTGKLMAQMLGNKQTSIDLAAFDPGRFS